MPHAVLPNAVLRAAATPVERRPTPVRTDDLGRPQIHRAAAVPSTSKQPREMSAEQAVHGIPGGPYGSSSDTRRSDA